MHPAREVQPITQAERQQPGRVGTPCPPNVGQRIDPLTHGDGGHGVPTLHSSSFCQTQRPSSEPAPAKAGGERLICASRGFPLSIVTVGQEPHAWQVASSHTGCKRSPEREG
jgi:hypothetical protein